MKTFLLTINLLFSSFAFGVSAEEKKALETYESLGKAILSDINANKVKVDETEKKVAQMVEASMVLFEGFAKKFPESQKLLDHIKSQLSALKTASFEVLEKDIHDGGKLGKDLIGVDLKSEAGEKYTDPLHTLVHPLMTLKALEKKDLKAAKEELNEGLEQAKNMAKHLK